MLAPTPRASVAQSPTGADVDAGAADKTKKKINADRGWGWGRVGFERERDDKEMRNDE